MCQGDGAVNVHPDGIMSELGPPKTERASVFLVYAYRKPTAVHSDQNE